MCYFTSAAGWERGHDISTFLMNNFLLAGVICVCVYIYTMGWKEVTLPFWVDNGWQCIIINKTMSALSKGGFILLTKKEHVYTSRFVFIPNNLDLKSVYISLYTFKRAGETSPCNVKLLLTTKVPLFQYLIHGLYEWDFIN